MDWGGRRASYCRAGRLEITADDYGQGKYFTGVLLVFLRRILAAVAGPLIVTTLRSGMFERSTHSRAREVSGHRLGIARSHRRGRIRATHGARAGHWRRRPNTPANGPRPPQAEADVSGRAT